MDPTTGLTAGSLMTSPAVACKADAFFEEIVEILADRDISGMPVLDDEGEVIGVVSERDLAHALGGPMVKLTLRRHSERPLPDELREIPRRSRRIREVMTSPALTVEENTPVEEVARSMRVHKVNRLPVLRHGSLVGVVTRGDVLGAIGHVERVVVLDAPLAPEVVGTAGPELFPMGD
jgi:CBS domain-containing protein